MSDLKPAALPAVTLATNNGDIGGGEVMMLRIAAALRDIGASVTIVAPSGPDAVARAARAAGHAAVVLQAEGRKAWMRSLRRWDSRQRTGLLWCNGLVPATATAGHPHRIVHLHQEPHGVQRALSVVARRGADAVLVPSQSMLARVPGARVLPNWTGAIAASSRVRNPDDPFVVGFLGRISMDKGIGVLAEAMRMLQKQRPGAFRLSVGGESRFVSAQSREASEAALATVSSVTDSLGWVDTVDFLHRIDLLVVPSIWSEPFGLVAAEAMAARVPLVVSDAGALPEVVGRDYPHIVPAGDPRRLADEIAALAMSNLDGLVTASSERWRTHFSAEAGEKHVRHLLADLTA